MGFCIPHDYAGIFLAKQLNSILLIAQQASDHRHRSAAALHEHGCDRQAEDYMAAFGQPEVWTDTASANHRCLRTGPTRSSLCHLRLWARLAGARLAWARTEHSSGGATAQQRSSSASAGAASFTHKERKTRLCSAACWECVPGSIPRTGWSLCSAVNCHG